MNNWKFLFILCLVNICLYFVNISHFFEGDPSKDFPTMIASVISILAALFCGIASIILYKKELCKECWHWRHKKNACPAFSHPRLGIPCICNFIKVKE